MCRSTIFRTRSSRSSPCAEPRRRQTWVGGVAFERSTLDPRDQPQFAYGYNVPGVFAQDDIEVSRWLTLSASGRVDVHNEFGTFVSPRISALLRHGAWTTRASVGERVLRADGADRRNRGRGTRAAHDPDGAQGGARPERVARRHEGSGPDDRHRDACFGTTSRDPAVVDRSTYTLASLSEPTITSGFESVATFRRAPFSVTGTYTYVHSREGVGSRPRRRSAHAEAQRRTGRHVGTRRPRTRRAGSVLHGHAAPRGQSRFDRRARPYVLFGGLVERRFGRVRLFVNAENLGGVRQTRWDPLVRPQQAVDGRWTVDAWAPLDGRVINGGVRIGF